ncbi:hypothetical protein OG799_16740 [Micromonospora sp. NBC_00898]|nr:hypothetical protein OG799_16740 [Micromonospora sp. NBC_00898]
MHGEADDRSEAIADRNQDVDGLTSADRAGTEQSRRASTGDRGAWWK